MGDSVASHEMEMRAEMFQAIGLTIKRLAININLSLSQCSLLLIKPDPVKAVLNYIGFEAG